MKLAIVGRLLNTHGLKGELVLQVTTDSPEVYDEMQYMMLSKNGDVQASLEIEYLHHQTGDRFLAAFKGVEDIDEAKRYKGMDVVVPEGVLPELEGEIYWRDLEGESVFDINGDLVGTLDDFMEAGGSEVFRIKCADGYYLISNNIDHVLEINVKEKKLVINRDGLVSEEI